MQRQYRPVEPKGSALVCTALTHPETESPVTRKLSPGQTAQIEVNANKRTATRCTVKIVLWNPDPPTLTHPSPEPFDNTQTLLGRDGTNSGQRKQTNGYAMHSQYRHVEP